MPRNSTRESHYKFALLLSLLCTLLAPRNISAQTGVIVIDTVHSPALERNLLGDSPERSVSIYLPPSYKKFAAARYPAVYLLHGITGNNTVWAAEGENMDIRKMMDNLIVAGKIREMILVMPDGNNKYLGSIYTNSATTGNWEDFLTRDLIRYIDSGYRTIPQAASRGIAGHSMGGYGAIKLAMKHPDIYSAVYGLSSCCLGWAVEFSLDNPAWDSTLGFNTMDDFFKQGQKRGKEAFYSLAFMALSAAWSPNPRKPPFFVDFPVERRDGIRKVVEEVKAKWSANMPLAMIDQYRSNLAQLRGLAFDVGKQDEFPDIPAGSRALSQLLTRNGIQHTFEEYEGNHHSGLVQRIEKNLLPFFSRILEFKTLPASRSFRR